MKKEKRVIECRSGRELGWKRRCLPS